MESLRSFLVIALALVSFLLWQQWQVDYGPKPVVAALATPATQTTGTSADVQLSGAIAATPTAADTTAGCVTKCVPAVEQSRDRTGHLPFNDLRGIWSKRYPQWLINPCLPMRI